MLGFCGERGLVWLLFMSLNLSHRMYRKGFKNELNFFFFPSKGNLGEEKDNFLGGGGSDRCVAGPLIYVDVSLHSNKKKPRKLPVLVSVECFSRTASFHHAAANRRPAWEAFLCGSRSWVALKHLQLLVFMCGPICFLATKPPPRYYLQIAADAFASQVWAGRKKRLIMVREEGQNATGAF